MELLNIVTVFESAWKMHQNGNKQAYVWSSDYKDILRYFHKQGILFNSLLNLSETLMQTIIVLHTSGRRVCIGENLGRMEVFLFTVYIVHQFDLSIPDGEPAPKLRGILAFNYASDPFTMTAKKRK